MSEKQRLINDEEESPPPYTSGPSYPPDSEQQQAQPPTADPPLADDDEVPPSNAALRYLYIHRARVPGYGLVKLVRKASLYSLYVLFVLLMAYLLNQLDRYTLPIVTSKAGYDLKYGDKVCMTNTQVTAEEFKEYNVSAEVKKICGNDSYVDDYGNKYNVKQNQTYCEGGDGLDELFVFLPNETNETNATGLHVCEFNYSGSGITYQIVAGPVFNNLYPLAGLFTGFLADYGRRTLWLAISLLFWSVVTGVTGFAKAFWELVVLRALLAIGAAGCNPFAVSLIGDYFPVEVRGTAISIYYFGIYIGYSLAFAIGNGIEKVLNWRWVFFISGMAGIAVVPFVLFTIKEPKRKKNPVTDQATGEKVPVGRRILLLVKTFIMPGMLTLCIAGGIRNAGGYVWAYNTQLFFEKSGFSNDHIRNYMSWIPLVAGSIGAIVGGIISDVLVKGRGPYMRIWVLIISQIAAAPFAAGALFLPNPWCFLSLIPSNVLGEMWIGVTSAIVVDLAPSKIRTGAIAVYLFIITVIGGNFNLLVAPIRSGFNKHFSYLTSYRWALFLTFPGVYALSSLLFILAFFLLRLDLKHKRMVEAGSIQGNDSAPGGGDKGVTGGSGLGIGAASDDEVEDERRSQDKPI